MIPVDFGFMLNTVIQSKHNDFIHDQVLNIKAYGAPVEYTQKVLGVILTVILGYYRTINLIRIKE